MAVSCGNRARYRARRERIEIEADEGETVLGEEVGDLRERQAVLLHVEQEVAARAGAEEIARGDDVLEPAAAVDRQRDPAGSAGCPRRSADSRARR